VSNHGLSGAAGRDRKSAAPPLGVALIGGVLGFAFAAIALCVFALVDGNGGFRPLVGTLGVPTMILAPVLGAVFANPALRPGPRRALGIGVGICFAAVLCGPLLTVGETDSWLSTELLGVVFVGPFVMLFGLPVVLGWVALVRLIARRCWGALPQVPPGT